MDRDLRPILRAGGLSIAKLARNANVAYPTAFWTVAGENPGVQAKTVLRLIEGSKGLLTLEDFAGLGSVGGADDAVALHEVNEMSGAAVPDTQTALQ